MRSSQSRHPSRLPSRFWAARSSGWVVWPEPVQEHVKSLTRLELRRRPDLDRRTRSSQRDRFGPPVTRLGVRLIRRGNGLATRAVRRLAQPIIPVIMAKMKPIAPSQSKSPASVPRLAEMSGSILLYMIGLLVNAGHC